MATKHQQPRSGYGSATEAHRHAQTQEARQPRAQAGQSPQAHGAEEAEAHVIDFVRTDAALQRLVTEPGETWILETAQDPAVALDALRVWSQTRGVVVLVFGEGEHFSCLRTQPGDTLVLHTARPDLLNEEALAGWAQSRGLSLAVLPPAITVQQLDEATLDQMGLMRKPAGLIIPTAGQITGGNGR